MAFSMEWYIEANERLAAFNTWRYRPGGDSYAEPAALTALSLIGSGATENATNAVQWLCDIQAEDGSVSVAASAGSPNWATALSISAWTQWEAVTGDDRFSENIRLAVEWAISHQGKTAPRRKGIGHDTSLRGWSWAANTHAWLEPTAMFITALIHAGLNSHTRTLEAVRLLLDRQLPQGGFNYGNTFVLGQRLLSHVQPTGIALSALSMANVELDRVRPSVDYLATKCLSINSTVSLCYGAIGLAAYGNRPSSLVSKLQQQYESRPHEAYQLALLALAAQPKHCLLIRNEKLI